MIRERCTSVLVTGGRDYPDPHRVWAALDTMLLLYGDILLFHGGAAGVDTFADTWAKSRQQICFTVYAQWDKYGKKAGPKRNEEMAALALSKKSVLHFLAFKGGRGTQNMIGIIKSFMLENEYLINFWPVDGEFWK